jgi:hypothetical protein
MSLPPDTPIEEIFWGFITFETQTFFPQYTQYNFNFPLYSNDFNLTGKNKNQVFADFYIRNKSDFSKPYIVLPELVKYFTLITLEDIQYIYKYGFSACWGRVSTFQAPGAITYRQLALEQFDKIQYTEIELPRTEDYYYNNPRGYFTKYNFQFDNFSNDFVVYGPKRLIFTSMLVRNQALSGVVYTSPTAGVYKEFEKYFNLSNTNALIHYLIPYGITSTLTITPKNFYNIDWDKYIQENPDLVGYTVPEAIDQWIQYGQFEQRIVPLQPPKISNIELIANSVAVITSDTGITGSGFLVDYPDNNYYVTTVNHLFSTTFNTKLFYATFEFKNSGDFESTIITGLFRIIGVDPIYDIAIGKFDPTLSYNIINKVDLSKIKKIKINVDIQPKINDDIYTFGVTGNVGDISFTTGKVINTNYTGNFTSTINDSEYILSQNTIVKGMSGGPQFIKDINNNYWIVAMTQKYLSEQSNMSIAIKSYLIYDFVSSSIPNWENAIKKFGIDYSKIELNINYSTRKTWLGVIGEYFDISLINKYNKLSTFTYTGGYVITDIINGFDFVDKVFTLSSYESIKYSVININTPLQNTNIFYRLIDSQAPIVIKKLGFFNALLSDYTEITIGKYSGQYSMSRFCYGFQYIYDEATTDPAFINGIRYEYPQLKITYYWFNGRSWVEDVEYVGGNDPTWYNTYSNTSGILITQHRFIIPYFLQIYLANNLIEDQTEYNIASTPGQIIPIGPKTSIGPGPRPGPRPTGLVPGPRPY